MDQAARGAKALEAKNFTEAISLYSQAINELPTAVDYYIKRSTAHQRTQPPDHYAALGDAEHAVVLATKRQKRELIAQAQLRRAIALFSLERYGDAEYVIGIVKELDPKEKSLPTWEAKLAAKLKEIDNEDDKRRVTVKKLRDTDEPKTATAANGDSTSGNDSQANAWSAATSSAGKAEAVQTPSNKIRHEWYQNNENVFVTLFAKGIPESRTDLQIHERALSISFPLPNSSSYEFSLDPLFAAIDPQQSQAKFMSTKLEITLRKAAPGQKWSALESSEPITSQPTATDKAQKLDLIKSAVLNPTKPTTAPSYPTSSRTGPKNWDKLADDLTKKPAKKKEGKDGDDDDEPEDTFDYEEEGGDPVNGFFKKLYSGADPDTRRAMMKSYQESNGTHLSTNWGEVSKGKVETSPPDGMEAKKWGS